MTTRDLSPKERKMLAEFNKNGKLSKALRQAKLDIEDGKCITIKNVEDFLEMVKDIHRGQIS